MISVSATAARAFTNTFTAVIVLASGVALEASSPRESVEAHVGMPILANAELLRQAGIAAQATSPDGEVAFARVGEGEIEALSKVAHENGRCGGFEALSESELESGFGVAPSVEALMAAGSRLERAESAWSQAFALGSGRLGVERKAEVEAAVASVDLSEIRKTVEQLSAYATRHHRSANPNAHVVDFEGRLRAVAALSTLPIEIEAVAHSSTPQKSLRVRIAGSERASEIVVLGGHLDSINQSWGGGNRAPGADDNASGSAALFEAYRILALRNERPQRTVEFYWYAGEEAGLLGSAEIAKAYRTARKDVVGVLQLDMILVPGDGPMVIASMTDFTSAWLRNYLVEINRLYVGVTIKESQCGYGCSDHASWHRQGYPALMPHESTMDKSNPQIHTTSDVIDSRSHFGHAAAFAKIAVAFAMDLGSSELRPPSALYRAATAQP